MSFWDRDEAVDALADAAIREDEEIAAARKERIAHVYEAVGKVEDSLTRLALVRMLLLIEQEVS